MRNRMLTALGGGFLILAAAQLTISLSEGLSSSALADTKDLLKGCEDVPEAVELANSLQERALRIERYLQDMDRKKSEIEAAKIDLTNTLKSFNAAGLGASPVGHFSAEIRNKNIERLISIYDQMKPEQAAEILQNLPPEFTAEILMRVKPDNSAKIISSIEAGQAAIFTTFMGSITSSAQPEGGR
ncbi:magnesium transporter MgtE N-terminal domain-containing protein [Paracoccus sp. (in: a-proteobacteria)]|uniref:MotE family protein n=1 Tax=Paracoccus sp. TaxID=267 RepID=UPI0028971E4A|nr:hypothetical protein [Paracoccus sp. (in: a-proteobacteria)]